MSKLEKIFIAMLSLIAILCIAGIIWAGSIMKGMTSAPAKNVSTETNVSVEKKNNNVSVAKKTSVQKQEQDTIVATMLAVGKKHQGSSSVAYVLMSSGEVVVYKASGTELPFKKDQAKILLLSKVKGKMVE